MGSVGGGVPHGCTAVVQDVGHHVQPGHLLCGTRGGGAGGLVGGVEADRTGGDGGEVAWDDRGVV